MSEPHLWSGWTSEVRWYYGAMVGYLKRFCFVCGEEEEA